jgi:hypothetical protein
MQKTFTKIVMPGPLREAHKIVIKGPAAAGADLTRSWYKTLPRASYKSFLQAPVKHGICKIFMQGALRKEFSRISKRPQPRENLQSKMPQAKSLRTPRRRLCASLRSWYALKHLRRAIYTRIYRKMPCHKIVAAYDLCEPAQSKYTWTSHKSHVMREFTGKMPCRYCKNPSVWTHCLGEFR